MRLLALVAFAIGCAAPRADGAPAMMTRARYLMGTVCTAFAPAADTATTANAIGKAFDEIAKLERVMSSWREDSELGRFNAASGRGPFRCSHDLYAVFDSALWAARETAGAFDPTIEPLNRAWDLRGQGRVPDDREVALARSLTGWRHLALESDARTARLDLPGAGVDLGGIGKGYALDRAAHLLRDLGLSRVLLNFGGEILSVTDGAPWQVTVADPGERLRPAVRLRLANAALSTSGQSERGIVVNGVRYGHILDPRRGTPLPIRASVSVIAGSATRADALSTGLLVMGREAAAKFAGSHPEVGVLWLEPDGDAVRAWKWNLAHVDVEPGVTMAWMNE